MRSKAKAHRQYFATRLPARCFSLVASIAVVGALLSTGPANAVAIYSSSATASLMLKDNGFLDKLLYLGSNAGYSATVVANSNGFQQGTSVSDTVDRSVSPPPSFSSIFSGGSGLLDLFPFPNLSPPGSPTSALEATAGGAHAEADNKATFAAGNRGIFEVSASGFATDPIEFSNSRSRLDLFVSFQNSSDVDMTLEWQVVYGFHNEARADPRGSAFAESSVRAATGMFLNGGIVFDEPIFKAGAAACGFNQPCFALGETPPDPPNLEKLFQQTLAPGETQFFNIELVAAGNASVLPVPATLPLFLSGLGLLGLVSWRRRKNA